MSGTENSRGGADNPLFYVDDAGETAFGSWLPTLVLSMASIMLATPNLPHALVYVGRT